MIDLFIDVLSLISHVILFESVVTLTAMQNKKKSKIETGVNFKLISGKGDIERKLLKVLLK